MDITGIFLISGFVFVILVLLAIVIGPMFGWHIAAKYEEVITFASHRVPRSQIREAFVERGWTVIRDQPSDMTARTKPSWRSWGEIVTLQFHNGTAAIKSECSFPSQVVDYGRNRMNVRSLVDALKKKEPNQTPEPTAPSGRGSS
jgi:hypothetical protein